MQHRCMQHEGPHVVNTKNAAPSMTIADDFSVLVVFVYSSRLMYLNAQFDRLRHARRGANKAA